MGQPKEDFTTRIDAKLLAELASLAEAEGRDIQVLVEEAVAALISTRGKDAPRRHVMETYMATHEEYAEVYKKLAE